ncbi:hypothetical protein H6G72_07645 [Planktothricoides sp. FACHB-1370]|uniref:Uncharacterized protein n=1 Tax=Planktothricoides raciborskii FACHB-1370 TaxID=2949576 RepID=A0ABR8EAI3_9CYAN|nr:hypothetical protein [Planktothricoides sp. SR001]MBD2543723.1 hypothetical protein [Planktothricoides raciborskii FACHB-1370]MBD2582383.1 hypothetical protein [Planktothricoides raciborskii FACHB-1261]
MISTEKTQFLYRLPWTQKPGFFIAFTVGATSAFAPTYSPQKPGLFSWGKSAIAQFSMLQLL